MGKSERKKKLSSVLMEGPKVHKTCYSFKLNLPGTNLALNIFSLFVRFDGTERTLQNNGIFHCFINMERWLLDYFLINISRCRIQIVIEDGNDGSSQNSHTF